MQDCSCWIIIRERSSLIYKIITGLQESYRANLQDAIFPFYHYSKLKLEILGNYSKDSRTIMGISGLYYNTIPIHECVHSHSFAWMTVRLVYSVRTQYMFKLRICSCTVKIHILFRINFFKATLLNTNVNVNIWF